MRDGGVGSGICCSTQQGVGIHLPPPTINEIAGQVDSMFNLNNNPLYDATNLINNFFNRVSDEDFYLLDGIINSPYYDINSFIQKYSNTTTPLILSLNIRSLSSNFTELMQLINNMEKNNISIYAIVLQETWNIKYTDLLTIPGFYKIHLKLRTFSNGGGVGIYVKEGVSNKIVEVENSYREKIFESITIEMSSGSNKIFISNIYRSPSPIHGISSSEQLNTFNSMLDEHLTLLNNLGSVAYVFSDSNIDLSKINLCQQSNEYADTILCNGFIQTLTRSTRIQGNSHSLIDHILTNDISVLPKSGILINDISDHFITFTEIHNQPKSSTPCPTKCRAFTQKNIENFRNCLRGLSWHNVTNNHEVDGSFNEFWNDLSMLYDLNFPLQKFKFNKNIHLKYGFMTQGLLVSR